METLQNVDSLSLYQAYRNGNINLKDESVIYSSPHIHAEPSIHEKYAVKVIMEKYDSIKCLNTQIEGLQIEGLQIADSRDSITKSSLDDGSSRQGSSTTEEYEDPEYHTPELQSGELSVEDVLQIEVFFRSHKTYVFVCRCLANLYFTSVDGSDRPGEWELARTGVPVLLLDKGETKARSKRKLQIVLAEKGSGFVLWQDVIDNLSNYRAQDGTFHTMFLSVDHRRMAGLSYDNAEAAEGFMKRVEELTSDPLNISLSVPKQKKKKMKSKKKEKVVQLRKCDISPPCRFEHVTSVCLDDKPKLYSMATLVPPGETR